MNFCDFCDCDDCKYGNGIVSTNHAQTSDGRWICDICYTYDMCTSGPNRNPKGPCDNKNCEHRPKIISSWKKK